MQATGSESTEVHYHRNEFQQLGERLSELEQLLKTSRDSQVPLHENVNNVLNELTKLGKEVQKIAQDTGNIESELQQRQRDSQLLREMQKDLAHSEEKCQLVEDKRQLLQHMINKNEEEIKRLKKKLEKKKEELQSVQQEAQERKTKISKLQAELEEKHEEVKSLQKQKEELTRSYIAEKEELLQISLSDREEMEVWYGSLD